MKIKNNYKLSELCFYIFLFLIMIYYAFRRTTLNYEALNFTMVLAIPFVFVKIVLEKYTLKEFIAVGVLVVLGGISAVLIKNTSILVSFFIIIGMKNIDRTIPLKIVFYMRLTSCLGLFIGTLLGFVDNSVRIRVDDSDIVRYSMGYSHPNVFGVYIFTLISLWFILYGNKRRVLKILVSLGATIFCFMVTNSRTSLMLNLFYIFMAVFVNKIKDIGKLRFMAKLAFPFCFALSIAMTIIYNTGIGSVLNKLLSSRLSLSERYLRVYGIKPFGQTIEYNISANSYSYLDSGYLSLFIQFGLIVGIVCLVLYYHMGKMNYTNRYIYIAVIGFAVYGIIEDLLSSFLFNYLWILIGAAFYDMLSPRKENALENQINTLLEDRL